MSLIKVSSWNVKGAVSPDRFHALCVNLRTLQDTIVCLQETQINKHENLIESHVIFGTPLASIAIPKALKEPTCNILNERTVIFSHPHSLIICIYAPASSCSSDERKDFWRLLPDTIAPYLTNKPVILAGDLNMDIHKKNDAADALAAMNLTNSVRHTHQYHTFKGAGCFPQSCIDFVTHTHNLQLIQSRVREATHFASYYDHKMVHATLSYQKKRYRPLRTTPFHYPDSEQGSLLNQLIDSTNPPTTPNETKPPLAYHPTIPTSTETKMFKDLMKTLNKDNNAAFIPHTHLQASEHLLKLKQADANKAYQPLCAYINELCAEGTSRGLFQALHHITNKRKICRHLTTDDEKLAIQLHFTNLLAPTTFINGTLDENVLPPVPNYAIRRPQTEVLTIFTDGSVFQNEHCGAAAFFPETNTAYSIAMKGASINTMETAAIVLSLQLTPNDIHIFSDSLACVHNLKNISAIARSNFENLPCSPFWRFIYKETLERTIQISHVRAHNNNYPNEVADRIAKSAALFAQLSPQMKYAIPEDESWILLPEQQALLFIHSCGTPQRFPPLPTNRTTTKDLPRDDTPTTTEIDLALQDLPKHKQPGPDGITNETLVLEENREVIYQLITSIWTTNITEPQIAHNTMICLAKAGHPKMTPPNVRGITLANTITKLLMRIIMRRNPNPQILPQQLGFQRARSCIQAICIVKNVINHISESGKEGVITFIDIKKAFDSTPRMILENLLTHYGFSPTAIQHHPQPLPAGTTANTISRQIQRYPLPSDHRDKTRVCNITYHIRDNPRPRTEKLPATPLPHHHIRN